ncbi:MAG: hypothetical protein Q9201_003074 [Fulgogasparrea decipioides]
MSTTDPFGPLETLLLLRGIQAFDSGPLSFDTLATSLKDSEVIPENGSSNYERFDAQHLESLYLKLLKEEVKLECQKNGASSPAQNGQSKPRKRKLSSPRLETLEEASHHRHLLPQVATRVYSQYRDVSVKKIKDEERNYHRIQREIQEIERGEWDPRLQNDAITSKRDSKGPTSIQTLLQDEADSGRLPVKAADGLSVSPLPPILEKTPIPKSPPSQAPSLAPVREDKPQDVLHQNDDSNSTISASTATAPQNSTSVAAVSPKNARQVLYQSHELPSNASRPPSQPGSAENGMPFLPPPLHSQQGYMASPPHDLHRRQPSQPSSIAPSSGTRPHQPSLPPAERSSGSPIILPPPPGMLRTTSSPSKPLDALADMTGQQYRQNTTPSSRPPQPPNGPQHPVQLPLPSNYPPKSYQYPPYENRSPYPHPYAPYHPAPAAPYHQPNHSHVPPYQHPTPNHGQPPYYAPRQSYPTPVHTYPQYSPYSNVSPYTSQGHMASPYAQYPPPRALEQKTPVYTSDTKRKPPRPSPINTLVSSTKWKNVDRPGELRSPKSPTRPDPEEISPISEKAPSPALGSAELRTKGDIGQRDQPLSATGSFSTPSHIAPSAKRGRLGRPRGTSTRGRGARAASTASSARQTSTRSVSAASGADELSLETPHSTTRAAAIKPEPPATPAWDSSASAPPISTTDNEGNRKSTRHRRETLRGIEMSAETTRAGTKRKRTNTVDNSDLNPRPAFPSSDFEKQKEVLSATHILASRNLPRTSATLMNDISAHKLANMFAKPLTEREAPGYHSLIYRPQDLKSIKQAITNGNRALTATFEQERNDGDDAIISVAGAGESDARVWIKRNEEIVPPKGIVNSAQLEKEVMRVFANAVMFNPDTNRKPGPAFRTRAQIRERHIPPHLVKQVNEDEEEEKDEGEDEGGVVKDTREMFEDVEKIVEQWRAAEEAAAMTMGRVRGGEMKDGEQVEEEVDELAGEDGATVVEDTGNGERPGKRRRR